MLIFLGKRHRSFPGTLGRAAALVAFLTFAGAAAAATTGATAPLASPDPAETAPRALALPDPQAPTALEPVGACARLDGGPACLDPALPGRRPQRPAPVLAAATSITGTSAGSGGIWGGKRSGLPWASGASSAGADFEAWRGRKLDVKTVFLAHRYGWAELTQTSFVKWVVALGAKPVLGVGLLPASARGQLAQCANGAFDAHIRKIGQGLVKVGAGDAILRLGWEANRMGDFPWGVLGDGSSYKNC
ncbi:hypothetical protein U1T56_22745, partial [Geminicoccaceae bacterium SYSU G07066]